MGKSSSPPPPDYTGAAEATAAGDLEALQYQTLANRADQFTPEGSVTWDQNPSRTFDQSGFDQAYKDYESNLSAYQNWQPQTSGDNFLIDNNQSRPMPTAAPNKRDYWNEGPTKWTQTTELNPTRQETFEATDRMNLGLAGLGETAVGQMEGLFADPFRIEGQAPGYQGAEGQMPGYQGPGGQMPGFQGPEGSMPSYGEHRQGVVDAMMSRVNTDIGRDRGRTNSQLVAQGIPVGTEAYQREMEQLDRKQTDARQQAEIAAESMAGMGYSSALAGRGMESSESMNDFMTAMQARGMTSDEAMDAYGTGMQTRNQVNQEGIADFTTGLDTHRQNIQDALLPRNQQINEQSAFRTGSQVGMPQFSPYGQQGFAGGPDYATAATQQGQYDLGRSNQDIAQQNAMMSGLFSLGSAGIGAYPFGGQTPPIR